MNRNIFAIDHGNYSIKTTKVTFPCGLSKEKYEPYDDANYIFYNEHTIHSDRFLKSILKIKQLMKIISFIRCLVHVSNTLNMAL